MPFRGASALAMTKSSFFLCGRLFGQFQHVAHFFHDLQIVLPAVGLQTMAAILDPLGGVGEIAAALIAQGIQRAIAEQTAEALRIRAGMAGKIFTFPVLKIIVMCQWAHLPI